MRILLLLLFPSLAFAQFDISLESIEIQNLSGIQSFTYGQNNGKWLIVGGRLDGLHQRQPRFSFDLQGHNDNLIVIDPIEKQFWTKSLQSLSQSLLEQLRSTNMQFFQEGNNLILTGGYGYSETVADHTTFPFITIIDIENTINAVINNDDVSEYIIQYEDERFAVTGGDLEKIEDTYYLIGGHRFEGRYNPMNGPSFTQEYTNAIRKFNLEFNDKLIISNYQEIIDNNKFHRRDFNTTPQIMPDGTEGITAFSGVFQEDADIPYLNAINITENEEIIVPDFSQYYNHYHCANIPIYDSDKNEMHTIFFGGIAQYYDSLGVLVRDDDVPFVNTIAMVTRDSEGTMKEYKLPIEMPALLGAGSEFIPNQGLKLFKNGVIDLASIDSDTISLGYIFGGIESSSKNIFWNNDGSQSNAVSNIYEVILTKNNITNVDFNEQSSGSLRMQVYPNPRTGKDINIKFFVEQAQPVFVKITDINGKIILKKPLKKVTKGENYFRIDTSNYNSGSYFITLETNNKTATQKIIFSNH